MSTLEKWYNGELYPAEQILPHSAEYRSLNQKLCDERKHFVSRLSAEDKERFEKWEGLRCDSFSMDCYASFSYGFKLGVQLMCETFMDDGTLATSE